jgi:hypothetical protein
MYSCFISYCHGQNELTKSFVKQLTSALESYLEPYLDEPVYIDEKRLSPGYNYNEALAEAICNSICMIVIYSPKYERHPYCLREFEGMKEIEANRRQLIGKTFPNTKGMIIPIIFRGKPEDLPPSIKDCKHYCDFSRFTTASSEISKNPEYTAEIEKIAQLIYEHYKMIHDAGIDVCTQCETYHLPSEDQIRGWRQGIKKIEVLFPGRG